MYIVLVGLVVSVHAIGHKASWFKPSRTRWTFKREKKSAAHPPSEGK